MFSIIVLLVVLTAGYKAETYDNELNGILNKGCADNQAVSMIKSVYDDSDKDRQWKIECKNFVELGNCVWFSFNNLHNQELQFNCPADHIINGIYSIYDINNEDRNWHFKCCPAEHQPLTTFECRETSKVNYFKKDFTWHVPGENFLKGFSTHGRNDDGDHRWSFSYCRAVIMDSETTSPILVINSQTQNSLTEGDIVVHSRDKRSVKVCDDCFWSKGVNGLVAVPYTISDTFSSNEKTTIENNMNEFHLSSCVRFVAHTTQPNYVSIVKKDGCWSMVGQKGGEQELSLGVGCMNNGVIQHEFMHMLGFWHEQSRSDRDLYVKINLDNVQQDYVTNFGRKDTLNLNVPYDYSSVMHYGRKEFTNNGQDTVTPLITSESIGQRIGMTENDVLKINKLYSCKNYLHKKGDWDSELGESFTRQCPEGQAVSGIISSYSSIDKDRHWGVTCKAFEITPSCLWSSYTNEPWHEINFDCGYNRVIAGVHSVYDHTLQDRKWKFYCCQASVNLSNLKPTPFINYYGEYFSWKVASSNYITAVRSSFDTTTRDRLWSFSYQLRSFE